MSEEHFPWITTDRPALVLAPMEGVTDAPMRALFTELGGLSFCVSEFLRVSQDAPPIRTFHHHVPELTRLGRTPSGTEVQVQLLGGDPDKMALSAERAFQAGARAIDINFGCPAPTVNRNDGGATLLKYPERIIKIVESVRAAVPKQIPVSAKLRLGWENVEDIFLNAEMAARGGASWLTIHARTRMQGYAPPAHWKVIGRVRERLELPVIANGEIWTREDFLRCREETGARHFMIGRGAMADPSLVQVIARELGLISGSPDECGGERYKTAGEWLPLLRKYEEIAAPFSKNSQYTARRIKQWLSFLASRSQDRLPWIDSARRAQSLAELFEQLQGAADAGGGSIISRN